MTAGACQESTGNFFGPTRARGIEVGVRGRNSALGGGGSISTSGITIQKFISRWRISSIFETSFKNFSAIATHNRGSLERAWSQGLVIPRVLPDQPQICDATHCSKLRRG